MPLLERIGPITATIRMSSGKSMTLDLQNTSRVNTLFRVLFLLLASIAIGVFLPWLVATLRGTASLDDMLKTMAASNSETVRAAATKFKEQEANNRQFINLLENLAIVENDYLTDQQLEELAAASRHYVNSNDTDIKVVHFGASELLLLYPVFFTCFGVLIWIFPLDRKVQINAKTLLMLWVILVFISRCPTWIRNTSFLNQDRAYFADAHLDVTIAGFITQEVLACTVLFLVSLVWLKWIMYAQIVELEIEKSEVNPQKATTTVANSFLKWQIASLLVSLAFCWYSWFFWNRILVNGSIRYLPHALIVHALWIATIYILSMPFHSHWLSWTKYRTDELARIIATPAKNDDVKLSALKELKPISNSNLIFSTVFGAIAFLYPIVTSFFR